MGSKEKMGRVGGVAVEERNNSGGAGLVHIFVLKSERFKL